jgi:hypothetical protein
MLELSLMLMELNVGGGLVTAALGLALIIGFLLLDDGFIPAAFCAFVGWAACTLAFGGTCPGISGAVLGLLVFLLFG